MKGSQYCYRHNPEIPEEEKLAVSRKGGINNRARVDLPLFTCIPVKLRTTDDVLHLLEQTLDLMFSGILDQRIASTAGYLLNIALRALETNQLEQRLKRLEEIVNARTTELI